MAGRDFSAELFGPSAGRDFSAELFGAKPSKERTFGEAAKDIAAGVVSGAGSLVQLPGQLYGLATGDFSETGALGLGKDISKFGEEMKSAGLKAREAERAEKIKTAEQKGQWEAFKTAFGETIKDPALLTSFLAEQAPQLLVPFGAAKVAQIGTAAKAAAAAQGLTGTAAKEAVESVTKAAAERGTRAAIGAGAVQQGADVGAQAYEDIYKELISKNADPKDAAQGALNLARAAGASGALISVLAQRLPGARTLEESFAGVPGTGGRLLGAVKGALGEGISEVAEETGGKFGANLAMREVKPEQSLLEGLGQTAGMAAIGGVGMGGVSGLARSPARPEVAPSPEVPRTGPLTSEEQAELDRQRAASERPKTTEELLAGIQTGKPTTAEDIARIRDEHETAVIEGLLAQDAEMKRANELAGLQREQQRQQTQLESEAEAIAGGISDIDRRVREGRIFSSVQDLIDRNIPFASTAINDINQKFGVINEAPLTEEERARIENIMGMVNTFTNFVNLPVLAPKPVDQFAENQAMEALIKERTQRGQAQPVRTAPPAPSTRIEEAPVSQGVGEGAAVRPEGRAEPSITEDRELVTPAPAASTAAAPEAAPAVETPVAPVAAETPARPDRAAVQSTLNTLADGDTIVTDDGDRIPVTRVLRNKAGDVTTIVTTKIGEEGYANIDFDGLASLVTPQPYIDSTTGERKFSAPATIEKPKAVATKVAEATVGVATEKEPATRKEAQAFGKAIGAAQPYPGDLRGRVNLPAQKAAKEGNFQGVLSALEKSKNVIVSEIAKRAKSLGTKIVIDNNARETYAGPSALMRQLSIDGAKMHLEALNKIRALAPQVDALPDRAELGYALRDEKITAIDGGEEAGPMSLEDIAKMGHSMFAPLATGPIKLRTKEDFKALQKAYEDLTSEYGENALQLTSTGSAEMTGVAGVYDSETDTIRVPEYSAKREEVLSHEIVHAQTVQSIASPTLRQKPIVAKLNKLYEHVKKELETRPGRVPYGIQSIQEFVAEGMGNPAFQFLLKKIKYENTSAWDSFVQTIANLIGVKRDTAFTELLSIYSDLTTEQKAAPKVKASAVEAPAAKPAAPPILDTTGLKEVKGRHPQVQAAAKLLQDKKITREEFEKYVDYYKPIQEVEADKLLPPTSDQRMNETVNADKRDKINVPVADGTKVGLRMDLPARERGGSVVSIHEGKPGKLTVGKVLGFRSTGWLKNVTFEVRSQEKGLAVAAGAAKAPQQTVEGTWFNLGPEETYARVKELMKDPVWTQIGFDPSRHGYFYDRKTREPVVSASEMYQVGQFLLAKDVQYAPKTGFLYSLGKEQTKQLQDFQQTLRNLLNKFGLKDVGLSIVEGMDDAGSYAQQLIRIAEETASPIRTLRHEAIHALRELGFFTEAQWNSLSKMAKDKWIDQYLKQRNIDGKPLKAGEESRYDAYMREYNGDIEKITEEAVADAFADFEATKPPAGMIQALLNRMKDLFQSIKSALTKVESPEQIFGKVEKGELKAGARKETGERKSMRNMATANFLRWFGDSKVVDAEGQPLVVYHGTDKDLTEFRSPADRGVGYQSGLYFTSDSGISDIYGKDGAVYPVYLSIKNPLDLTSTSEISGWKGAIARLIAPRLAAKVEQEASLREGQSQSLVLPEERARLEAAGYDGIKGAGGVWIAFRPEQIKSAIGNNGDYSLTNADIRKSLGGVKSTPGQQALETIRAMGMGVKPPEPGRIEKAKTYLKEAGENPAATKESAKKTLTKWLDAFETMAFSGDAAFNNKVTSSVIKDIREQPEILGLLLEASQSQAVNADNVVSRGIIEGSIEYNEEMKKWQSVKKDENFSALAKKLDDLAKKYGTSKEEMERIAHTYLVVKRLPGIIQRNKDLDAAIEKEQATAKPDRKRIDEWKALKVYVSPEQEAQVEPGLSLIKTIPELKEVSDIWQGIRQNTIKAMVDSGLWSPEYATNMFDNIDYVPYYREEQLEEGAGPLEFIRGLQVKSKEFQLKGSGAPVNDVFDNMIRWSQYAMNRAIRAQKARQMIDAAKDIDIGDRKMAVKVAEEKRGMNIVRVFRDGKQELWDMADPMFVPAFAAIQNVSIPMFKWAAKVADVLRNSVVLYPMFSVAQVPQDSFAAMFTSGLKPQHALKIPILAVKEFVKTLSKSSATHNELVKFGAVGARDFSADVMRKDAEIYAGLKPPKGGWGKTKEVLEHIAMAADNAVRQAVYEASVDQGLSKAEALEKAFEIFNVRRRGTSKALNLAGQTIPFFYAYLAAQRVAYRTITGVGTSPTERKAALQTLAATSAAVFTLSMLYAMAVGDDDDYAETPAAVRDRTLTIPGTGGVRIPLRTDFFLFPKIIAEHTYLMLTDKGYEDGAKFRRSMRDALVSAVSSPTPLPQVIKPVLEVAINYDFFTGKPVIGQFEKQKDWERQFNDSTSELSKLLGKTGLVSPIAVDHLIRGMFGSAGGLVMYASNFFTSDPDVPRPELSAQEMLAALPGTSGFLKRPQESALKNDFYILRDEVEKAVNTFNDIKTRSPQGMEAFLEDEKQMARLMLGKPVDKINRELSKIRRQMTIITNMPESQMSAEDKANNVRQLRELEREMLKSVNVKELREMAKI